LAILKRLDNVGVAVRDVQRAVDFYSRVLGVEAIGDDNDGSVTIGDISLYIFRSQAGGEVGRTTDYYHNPVGLDHLAFEVDDLESAGAELEQRGVTFAGPAASTGTLRYRGFTDLDGNMLYIIQRIG
jgi:catechol 2,3-dioxygenase-like lactoylglutathione lyase family enzyme